MVNVNPEAMSPELLALLSDREALRAALNIADVAPLLMVLTHLGGDAVWLDRIAPYITGPWSYQDKTPPDIKQELVDALIGCLQSCADSNHPLPKTPPEALLSKMLCTCTGQVVPPEYLPVALEEMDLANEDPRAVAWRKLPSPERLAGFQVLVIGAGFSGVATGIRLQEAGIPYTIVEKNESIGGTWYENTHPGVGVDTANSPWRLVDYRDMTLHFNPKDYAFGPIANVAHREGIA